MTDVEKLRLALHGIAWRIRSFEVPEDASYIGAWTVRGWLAALASRCEEALKEVPPTDDRTRILREMADYQTDPTWAAMLRLLADATVDPKHDTPGCTTHDPDRPMDS